MVTVDFTYSQQDCLRAWRRHFRERMNLPLDIGVGAVLAAIGLWQWWTQGLRGLSLAALGSAAALALLVLSALYFVPLIAYRRNAKLKQPYHLRFAEEGIEFRTDNIESRLGWELYSRALIDHHSYLLYHGKAEFTIIPKRVLPDEESRRRFERLIESKVQAIIRR